MKNREESHQDSGFSLGGVHGSVPVPRGGPVWRRWWAIAGPALMVSVGYMDPGNWATDLAGGSRYEYRLLWVLLLSNLMAVLLQSLAARLGIVRRLDLAQASREAYPRGVTYALYALAEIAIAACDLAEVIGTTIALNLLFHLPLLIGVLLTAFDTFLLLVLSRFGIRKLEAVILSLVGTIGLAFLVEIILARPEWGPVGRGFVPSLPDGGALYLAIAILGATIMPHNLYLHSALVQTRRFSGGSEETRRAIRLNTIDSAVVLNLAFLVNAAILIMAAAVFFRTGHHQIAEIQEAHHLLEPIVGASIAPLAFAVALLASGQGSTVTGTLAGQIVMEGYLQIRIRPWLRRLITRLAAVVPAALTILLFGERTLGTLLIFSQVILSLQLPFATIPLIHFVSDRGKMGEHAIGTKTRTAAWITAVVICALNFGLLGQTLVAWVGTSRSWGWLISLVVFSLGAGIGILLIWVTFGPWIERLRPRRRERTPGEIHHEAVVSPIALTPLPPVARVAIALDFSGKEERLLSEALRLCGHGRPVFGLFHVLESPSARAFGQEAADEETWADRARLESLASVLRQAGYETLIAMGAGDPVRELARLASEFQAELVVLGGHGHHGLSDVIHGTTAEALRHRIKASVLVIPLGD
jgi:manganese transport protein